MAPIGLTGSGREPKLAIMTMDQCVSDLCDLAKSREQEWRSHVDRIVHEYLVELGQETATKRLELADRFSELAPDRERSARIRERILRDN
jgi:hypothetical protein